MTTTTTTADKMVRRRVAVEFLGKGMTMAAVALVLGVSLSSVKRWKQAHRQGGDEALLPKPQLGPEPKLDASQTEQLQELLVAGPTAAGFSTELWTCRRVAEVVRREFGVDYHPGHLGRILHDLGFSPQKPQRRASERNESAIARWRSHDWPRIKKSADDGTPSASFSMNPAFVCSR
jgi:transposase